MIQKYQGDISILEIEMPNGLDWNSLIEHTVAYGETSGHRHVITAEREADVTFAEHEGRVYVQVKKGTATLNHWTPTKTKADHDPITLGVGSYQLFSQREFDELGERKVID